MYDYSTPHCLVKSVVTAYIIFRLFHNPAYIIFRLFSILQQLLKFI